MRGWLGVGLVGACVALAGCGGGSSSGSGQAPCPRIAMLADGADLTRFRPGAPRDLTAMVVDARIVGFDARCDFASRAANAVEVRITPYFEAERGPAAEARGVELPWFVVLSDPGDQETLTRVSGRTLVTFPPNVARTLATGQPVVLTIPMGGETRIADYPVRLSFQLTPDEHAFNRRRGPR
jgi:hypothetical protein